MRLYLRVLTILLALSFLALSPAPAHAQEQWPSGRDAGDGRNAPPSVLPPDAPPPTPAPASGAMPSVYGGVRRAAGDWRAPQGATIPAGDSADATIAAANTPLIDLIVHLALPSLAQQFGAREDDGARIAYAATVAAEQERVAQAVAAQGGVVFYRFSTLSSGLAVQMPAAAVPSLLEIGGVSHVTGVRNYTMNLTERAPFVGADFLHDTGVTGAGVRVAILDSGVDFTHLAFGGPGDVAAWTAAYYGADPGCDPAAASAPGCAYAQPADPAHFGPLAPRVKGGYDYVGEAWRTAGDPLLPDANPIDRNGHGTALASIVGGLGYPAGVNADGAYPAQRAGVAPGAELYSYRVCAAVGTACSGLALLAALDDAADLDNLPATHDPADIVNLSLSANYGQPEDSLTHFADAATDLGVLVVAAAGNGGDKPFIVGSPASGDGPLSVAETAAPGAMRYPLFYALSAFTGTIFNAVHQHWSAAPDSAPVAGPLYYGQTDDERRGCTLDANGAVLPAVNPFPDLTGQVALVDRGGCDFALKANNAAAAGARLVLIGLVAPGAPFDGNAAATATLPVFMVDQPTAAMLAQSSRTGVVVGVDPAAAISLANTVAAASSRGPRSNDGKIKPDLAAPGRSVAARAGSGSGSVVIGGASGAAALTTGVAALLKEAYGAALPPYALKALLMNSASLHIRQGDPAGSLAPITRMGGGQVDARAAFSATLLAWDSTDAAPLTWSGSMSFGYVPASTHQAITRTLTIRNLAAVDQMVRIDSYFRLLEDYAQGVYVTPAVSSALVPAGGSVQIPVVLEVYPAGSATLAPLHRWVIERGAQGANGELLRYQEYDGYLRIATRSGAPLHVVWQALPKAAAETRIAAPRGLPGAVMLQNTAPGVDGLTEVFDLLAADGNDYHYTVGGCVRRSLPPGCDASPVDIKEVGVRYRAATAGAETGGLLEFAVTLWDEPHRASQAPAEFRIYIDADVDGADDYVLFNSDAALDYSDGRSAVFVMNLSEGVARWHGYVDSTFNSQNFILPVAAAAIGAAPGQPLRFSVYAFNAQWQRQLWDCAPKQDYLCSGAYQYTPGAARFDVPAAQRTLVAPAAGATSAAWVSSPEADAASPAQVGLLLLHRNAASGRESDHLIVAPPFLPAASVALQVTPPSPGGAAYTLTAIVMIAGAGKTPTPAVGHEVFFTEGVFTAPLRPAAAAENMDAGLANFWRNPATGAIHYTLDFTGVATPTLALLHVGQPGVNGPMQHWLWDATGANAPRRLPATGVFTPTPALYSQLLQGNLYVQVHSADSTSAGLRGQIARTPSAFTDAHGVATLLWLPVSAGEHTIQAVSGPGGDVIEVAVLARTFLPLIELRSD
jgi:minor extracellular serine protease Vpr